MEYETSVVISAPLDVVWATVTNVEAWPRWTRSITSVRRLDDGPLAVGSRARIKQPRFPPLLWEVTELEPRAFFSWNARTPGVTTVAGHRLVEKGAEVTLVLTIRQSGLLAGLVGRLMSRRGRRYLGWEAEGMKRASEEAHSEGRTTP